MKIIYVVQSAQKNTVIYNIFGLELVFVARMVLETLKRHVIREKKLPTSGPIIISEKTDWLFLPKLIRDSSGSRDMLEVQISGGVPVKISGGEKRIVSFAPVGGSYRDIQERIKAFRDKHKLSDIDITNLIINRIRLNPHSNHFPEEDKIFLDRLIILLMGVEPSRSYFSIICLFMFFGLTNFDRKWNWRNAFVSDKDYHYDDAENKNMGGKLPMSANSTGPGNLKELDSLTSSYDAEKMRKGTILVVANHQHHAVPLKAMTLMINWLMRLNLSHLRYFSSAADREALLNRIQAVFIRNTLEYLELGRSFRSLLAGPRISYTLNTENTFSAQYTHSFFDAKHQLPVPSECVVYQHSAGQENRALHYYHVPFRPCKLIPEYVRDNKSKQPRPKEDLIYTSTCRQMPVADAQELGLHPCPHCYIFQDIFRYRSPELYPEIVEKDVVNLQLQTYPLSQIYQSIIEYHVYHEVKKDNFGLYCFHVHLWLVREKNWDSRKKGILHTIFESVLQIFGLYEQDFDDHRFVYLPFLESIIVNLLPILRKLLTWEDFTAHLKRLLLELIRTNVSGVKLIDQTGKSQPKLEEGELVGGMSSFEIQAGASGIGIELRMHALSLHGEKPPRLIEKFSMIVELGDEKAFLTEELLQHLRLYVADYFRCIDPEQFKHFFLTLFDDEGVIYPMAGSFGSTPFNYYYRDSLMLVNMCFFKDRELRATERTMSRHPFSSIRDVQECRAMLSAGIFSSSPSASSMPNLVEGPYLISHLRHTISRK